jgi:hypothetical protein
MNLKEQQQLKAQAHQSLVHKSIKGDLIAKHIPLVQDNG